MNRTDMQRARRAYFLVAVWLPLAVAILGLVLMIVWLPQMPETIAIHWNASGVADGFAAAWATPLLFAAVGVGLPVLFAVIVLVGGREGEWGPTYRFLGAMSLGTSVFLTTIITWSYGDQRGLASGHDAPSMLLPLAVGALLGVAAGVAGWFLQPKVTVSGGSAARVSSRALALQPGETAVWLRTTTMARGGVVGIVGATILVAVLAVVLGLTGVAIWWVLALVALLLAVLAVLSCVSRVRVDERGLRVASPVGLPRFTVPLADIERVSVVRINAMAEFGGWGIRTSIDGRTGVVLHSGDAIQVARTRGLTFVVTVDDAETGAALLDALVRRASATA